MNSEDFEKARYSLMESYNSKILSHVGYLVAIIIGSLTLISRWDAFFFNNPLNPSVIFSRLFFDIVLIGIFSVTTYIVIRTFFWTSFTHYVLGAQETSVNDHFEKWLETKEETKKVYFRENPYTWKIQVGAEQYLINKAWYVKRENVKILVIISSSFLGVLLIYLTFFSSILS
jgi:hypothetical protein